MADTFDKEFDDAWDTAFDKEFSDQKHKEGQKTKKKLDSEMGPDIKKLTEPSDIDQAKAVGTGLKRGIAALGGGADNAAGMGGLLGGMSTDVEEPTLMDSLKKTGGLAVSMLPDIKLPTNIVTQPVSIINSMRNSQGPVKNWENYLQASQPFNVSQALRQELAPDYEKAALEQAASDQESMTPGGAMSAAAEFLPPALMAAGGGVGIARSAPVAPGSRPGIDAPYSPPPVNGVSPMQRAKGAIGSFFSGGGNGKFSFLDRAGKALDALGGNITPGEGTPTSYDAFGIKQVPEEAQPVRSQDIEMQTPDMPPNGPDYAADAEPDTVFANRPEEQYRILTDELSRENLGSNDIMESRDIPPVPPDYLQGQSIDPTVFQTPERAEITAPPEQSSVFQYNGTSPTDNTRVSSMPNPAQSDVMAMADQLEAELHSRRANAPTSKGRMNDVNLNLPHDTIASRNMPRSDLTVEGPSPFNDEFNTVNAEPPVLNMRPDMAAGEFPVNQWVEDQMAQMRVPRPFENSPEPPEPDVPQWVRDKQYDTSPPNTFGDKGRPDDEQNILWLEQQIRANKFDKAEGMLRQRFGDEYVNYLLNEIQPEDLDLHVDKSPNLNRRVEIPQPPTSKSMTSQYDELGNQIPEDYHKSLEKMRQERIPEAKQLQWDQIQRNLKLGDQKIIEDKYEPFKDAQGHFIDSGVPYTYLGTTEVFGTPYLRFRNELTGEETHRWPSNSLFRTDLSD